MLKQQENLFLETSFPIYKINKCLLHAPGKLEGYISSGYGCFHSLSTTSWSATEYNFPMCYYKLSLISENQMEEKQISWTISIPTDSADSGYTVQNCVIHLLGKNSTGAFYEIEAIKDDDFIVSQSNTTLETVQFDPPDGEISGQLYIDMRNYTRRYEDIDSEVVAFWISGTFIDNENDSNTKDFVFFKFTTEDEDETYPSYVECYPPVGITSPIPASGLINGSAVVKYKLNNFILPRTWDITKLIVENSARQLLSRDFNAMGQEINLNDPGDITINKLSKYVYGTVGYSIGSKKISGFSEVYSAGHGTVFGWIQENYTYIENITTALSYDQTQLYDISHTIFADMPVILITGPFSNNSLGQGTFRFDGFEYYNPNSTLFSTNHPFFSLFFVDLYYQPMNSFNISYVKSQEDIDIPIQQYDSNVSGVTDFDRLSINEQEQVDRIGNEVLTINQRTDYYDDIQNFENGPLYFLDDTNRDGYINGTDNSIKYIIFKRSFTINNNHFNVSYVGSKDAILKNYFTSIRTKYRAYQYLDYGQSTLRKEKDVVFMRIASNRYNGDNRIWLGNYSTKKASNLSYFIYDLSNTSTTKISYECEQALTNPVDDLMPETADKQSIKNSVSLITTKNTLGIIYEYMDYIGAGTYLPQITTVSQFSYETSDDERLGGIPQKWQIWGNDYNISHTVSFVLDIDFYGQLTQDNPSGGAGNFIENTTLKIQKNPIVASTDLNFSFIDLENDDKNIFSVCDDNSLSAGNYLNVQRSFGKDYFELINHTVQFIYYAPNNDVLFGEDFISGCPLISRFEHPFNVICSSSTFDLNLIPHVMNENDKLATKEDDGDNFYEDYIAQNNYSMTVYWGNNNIIKLCHKNKEGQIIDLLAFKRLDLTSSSTTFYFSLNDTKTDYVMGLTNEGVLYRKYKVKTYTNEVSMPREVDDID